ncbi:CocE/NonD family hydrolase [Amaricoccus sp.]|uniref:alpha/beta hydrolase family protein n=1 Tax=Amaricoccus sp. TaxID=1872485 RepID=UPI00260933A6|nr:CocE/NonD family hydrolase [Amaricoccus sp.]HRO10284.1 dienelactone hydrolase family protein [Amaricoccus sp.]
MERAELARRFEIGAHPLAFRGLGPGEGGVRPIAFATRSGEAVEGFLLEPDGGGPAPAVLYVHAHGWRYDIGAREAVDGQAALAGPMGPALARAGFRVLAIDMPCFRGRAGTPESAAAKAALWRGGSLAGQMLGELHSALDWLAGDPGTDPGRIAVFGLSMGATLGYWLGAVEPRLAAVAHLCCFADFAPLIESGAHDLHGLYLTVPGLVSRVSNGEIAGMIAPRPQFVGLGEADPLTPPEAIGPALATLRAAYAAAGAERALRVRLEPGVGHRETPEMRAEVMGFLCEALGVARVRRRASD